MARSQYVDPFAQSGKDARMGAAEMTAPLVAEERVAELVAECGSLAKGAANIEAAIRAAIRETAEACAKVCDDLWDKEAQEAIDPKAEPRYHDAIECGTAIRARIGG